MCFYNIYGYISITPGQYWGYINWSPPCHTSLFIVLTPTPWPAKVQAHLHGKKIQSKTEKIAKEAESAVSRMLKQILSQKV